MTNSNNQTKGIYTLSDVEDLSCDTAANIQGGAAAMTLYQHSILRGTEWKQGTEWKLQQPRYLNQNRWVGPGASHFRKNTASTT